MQTDTLRSLADDIDAMRHQIRQRDATIIRLRAERDTLRRELEAAKSEIETDGVFTDGFVLGLDLRRAVLDLSVEIGEPIV